MFTRVRYISYEEFEQEIEQYLLTHSEAESTSFDKSVTTYIKSDGEIVDKQWEKQHPLPTESKIYEIKEGLSEQKGFYAFDEVGEDGNIQRTYYLHASDVERLINEPSQYEGHHIGEVTGSPLIFLDKNEHQQIPTYADRHQGPKPEELQVNDRNITPEVKKEIIDIINSENAKGEDSFFKNPQKYSNELDLSGENKNQIHTQNLDNSQRDETPTKENSVDRNETVEQDRDRDYSQEYGIGF